HLEQPEGGDQGRYRRVLRHRRVHHHHLAGWRHHRAGSGHHPDAVLLRHLAGCHAADRRERPDHPARAAHRQPRAGPEQEHPARQPRQRLQPAAGAIHHASVGFHRSCPQRPGGGDRRPAGKPQQQRRRQCALAVEAALCRRPVPAAAQIAGADRAGHSHAPAGGQRPGLAGRVAQELRILPVDKVAGDMYEAFFGLREKPFALTPNTGFLVQLAPYQACLNLLRVALGEGEGFIKVTGEVGTGKTLLCRALLNSLPGERYQLAYLPNPGMSPVGLRQALARELLVEGLDELDAQGVLDALHCRLIQLAAEGRSTVLLIDEAQALPTATLEALRLLTNLETEQAKLLQVVLFGQPELDATLARDEFRQLRQRITFSYQLRPLDVKDCTRAHV